MKKLSLCLGFIFISLQFSFAQNNWLNFKSHVAVTDFVETDTELLLATSNGLVKMDKYNFDKTYWTTQNTNLPSSHIQAITFDEQGNSWIGTYDGILALVTNTGFTEITTIPESLWGENHKLLSLQIDHNNVKWIGITNGLLRYDGVDWTLYNHSTITNNSIPLSDTWDIYIDEDNNIFVSSFEIYQFDGTEWTDLSEGTQLFSYGGAQLLEDQDQQMWWSNLSGSIGKYDGESWTEYHEWNSEQWDPMPPTESIKGILQAPNGTMIAHTESQVFHLINEVWVLQTNTQIEEANKPIDFFYYDQDQNTWLGAGIYLSKKTPDTFSEINFGQFPLHSNTIQNFAEAIDGSIYIVNNRSHIAQYKNEQWSELNTDPLRAINPYIAIKDIAIGPANQIYISSVQGLFILDAGEWTHYHADNNNAPFYSVEHLAVEQNGKLWITAYSAGIYYLENEIWHHYDPTNAPIQEGESFYDISIDQNNVIWTRSEEKKLYRITQGVWESIDLNQIDSLASFSGDLHIDQNNHLWISSWNDGVYQFDGNDWTHYNTINTSLASDQIYGISSDHHGILYFGTKLGLTTFDGSSWKNYNGSNSILYDSKPINKIFTGSDGTCWMTINYHGVYAFNIFGFEPTSSFSPTQAEIPFHISPNPARNVIRLDYQLLQDSPVSLSITDAQAKIHFQENLVGQAKGQNQLSLNLQHLAKGMYFIKIQSQNNYSVRKIILH